MKKIEKNLPDEQITKPPPEAPPVVLEPARHFSHPLDSLSFFSQPLPTELQAVKIVRVCLKLSKHT